MSRPMRRRTVLGAGAAALLGGAALARPAAAEPASGPRGYADVRDLHGTPAAALPGDADDNNPVSTFADLGAWHAYALPPADTKTLGFTGPLHIAQEYPWWLSEAFTRLRFTENGTPLTVRAAPSTSLPGLLRQTADLGGGLTATLELRFADHRTALVRARLANTGRTTRTVLPSWHGTLLRPAKQPMHDAPSLHAGDTGIAVHFARVRETWDYLTDGTERFEVRHAAPVTVAADGDSYTTTAAEPLAVPPRGTAETAWTESYTFTPDEHTAAAAAAPGFLTAPAAVAAAGDARWHRWTTRATAGLATATRRRAAVKAVETLAANRRSPAGMIRHDGVVPSLSYKWFVGLWAWDSWKQAAGTAVFDPALARDQIRSMFDHQIGADSPDRPQDAGMVPDAVFYNAPATGGGNWNERNSKPPLAAWAVWAAHRAAPDRAFLAELYPQLTAYQDWWTRNRAHSGDGLVQYGATVDPANSDAEQIRLAAAWESGMDNAPRFDAELGTGHVENRAADGTLLGYSLNQHSVDLNAYLAADRDHLALIARALGRPGEARTWKARAEESHRLVRERMFDTRTGWFHDLGLDGTLLTARGRGIEGAIPLWTGSATPAQARAVRQRLMDPAEFATPVPLPTVSRSSPYFDATAYWRGPVWLDQAFFALEGLRRYGWAADADTLAARLLDHADGLLADAPIHENYDPLTGEQLNSPDFSWSAAVVLLLGARGRAGG